MCIRDRQRDVLDFWFRELTPQQHFSGEKAVDDLIRARFGACLLYTSDAADERSSVDLGGRRIINKKTRVKQNITL